MPRLARENNQVKAQQQLSQQSPESGSLRRAQSPAICLGPQTSICTSPLDAIKAAISPELAQKLHSSMLGSFRVSKADTYWLRGIFSAAAISYAVRLTTPPSVESHGSPIVVAQTSYLRHKQQPSGNEVAGLPGRKICSNIGSCTARVRVHPTVFHNTKRDWETSVRDLRKEQRQDGFDQLCHSGDDIATDVAGGFSRKLCSYPGHNSPR